MKFLSFFLILLLSYSLSAQTQSGEIVYKIENNMDLEAIQDTLEAPETIKQSILRNLKEVQKALPYVVYRLKFNEKEAVFKMDDQMPVDQGIDLDLVKGIVFKPEDTYYTNAGEQILVWQNNAFEKLWLVQSRFEDREWKISDETKTIAGYECKKATTSLPPSRESNFQKMKITAWFAPQIPLPFGPKDYVGLLGMVLGFSMGKNGGFIYADQVKLSSKSRMIKRPTEGQKIEAYEYSQMTDSIFQARMNRYKSGRLK